MSTYTVGELAGMAGVSVRTLHHYDQIELLAPADRTDAGYRLYGEPELLRLQQIMFFRELDLPLGEIRNILDDPEFDQVTALQQHRRLLQQRMRRLRRLLTTVDKTIARLTEGDMTLTDEELYEGFTSEQIERYQREVREMYDPALVAEADRRTKSMSRTEWETVKGEGEEIASALAGLTDRAPDDEEVQALIARHHAWIERFYSCSAEVYRGLAELYTDNLEFRAYYDRFHKGLANFMSAAMRHYAATVLT